MLDSGTVAVNEHRERTESTPTEHPAFEPIQPIQERNQVQETDELAPARVPYHRNAIDTEEQEELDTPSSEGVEGGSPGVARTALNDVVVVTQNDPTEHQLLEPIQPTQERNRLQERAELVPVVIPLNDQTDHPPTGRQTQVQSIPLSLPPAHQPVDLNQRSTSLVKNPVLNLRGDEVPQHHQELLKLGPKFVPNAQRVPHMDIITVAECSSLKLEYSKKVREAQTLRKDVHPILKMKKPARDNLTRDQRRQSPRS